MLLAALFPVLLSAQIVQPGLVLLMNSGKTPLADVEISAPGADPVLSAANGWYTLEFKSKSNGDFARISVQKPGYEVVNGTALYHSDLNPDNTIYVIMCPAGEMERRLNDLAERHEKPLKQVYQDQTARFQADPVTHADTLARLEMAYYARLDALRNFNDNLVTTNLDDVSDLRREAMTLYEQGSIDAAIALLEEQRISTPLKGADGRDSVDGYQTTWAWIDKASLYAIKGDLPNAKDCYRKAIAVDTSDGDPMMRFAYFLNSQGQYDEVEALYTAAFQRIEKPDFKGIILMNLGAFYKNSGNIESSEKSYQAALQLYRGLSLDNPEAFRYLEAEALINLGELYYAARRMNDAETVFGEALVVYRQLLQTYPKDYQARLAYTLYYLALSQHALQKLQEAERAYQESRNLYAALAGEDPAFLANHASLSYHLGIFYEQNQQAAEALAAYQMAVEEYRVVAAQGNGDVLYYLAESLSSMGEIYYKQRRFLEAEKAYREAFDAYRAAPVIDPDQRRLDLAVTLFNLGNARNDLQKYAEALTAYTESIALFRQLATDYPDQFNADCADALFNLGNVYLALDSLQQAGNAYTSALELYRQYEEVHPGTVKVKIANVSYNLGVILKSAERFADAEKAYLEALTIYRQFAVQNPEAFDPEVASALYQLHEVYLAEKKNDDAEKALQEAYAIYNNQAQKGSESARVNAANCAAGLGVFYHGEGRRKEAEEAFLAELSLWRSLANSNPEAYNSRLALSLNNLAVQYELNKKYPLALNFYEESINLRNTALLAGKSDELPEWQRIHTNLIQVRDSSLFYEDYLTAVEATRIAAESCDKLKAIDPSIRKNVVVHYYNLAWVALFARRYELAEDAANRALEADPEQYHTYARLGHALCLQGKKKAAQKAYGHLKGRTDKKGKPYKQALLVQFELLETEGIVPPGGWKGMREWVEKW